MTHRSLRLFAAGLALPTVACLDLDKDEDDDGDDTGEPYWDTAAPAPDSGASDDTGGADAGSGGGVGSGSGGGGSSGGSTGSGGTGVGFTWLTASFSGRIDGEQFGTSSFEGDTLEPTFTVILATEHWDGSLTDTANACFITWTLDDTDVALTALDQSALDPSLVQDPDEAWIAWEITAAPDGTSGACTGSADVEDAVTGTQALTWSFGFSNLAADVEESLVDVWHEYPDYEDNLLSGWIAYSGSPTDYTYASNIAFVYAIETDGALVVDSAGQAELVDVSGWSGAFEQDVYVQSSPYYVFPVPF